MTRPVLHRLRRTRGPGGRHGPRRDAVGPAADVGLERTSDLPAAAPATAHRGSELADHQLLRVEARLLAEAKGNLDVEEDTRRWFALACARFAGAPVRQYLPILVEREVRERLRTRRTWATAL
jgi:hypothetical protein